jgi:hypothetical protein
MSKQLDMLVDRSEAGDLMKLGEQAELPQRGNRTLSSHGATGVDIELAVPQSMAVGLKDAGPECRNFCLIV